MKTEFKKRPSLIVVITIIFFFLQICNSNAQFIYVKYKSGGVNHRYPILKIDGDKCFINSDEAKANWDKFYPFFVSDNGDLYDAEQEKIGWYNGDDFYLMEGWVVSDNRKSYYTHKEMIYSKNEITGRMCNGQRFWFVVQSDGITYLQQAENRRSKTRDDGFSVELVGLNMDKKIAAALFWRFKIIQNDLGPCGFGTEDDRGELYSKMESAEEIQTRKQKEVDARIETLRIQVEARKKKYEGEQDSIRIAKEKVENDYIQRINEVKAKAFTKPETDFVGNWEFKSNKIYTQANEILIFEELLTVNRDRTYVYKSNFRKWLEKSIYQEYNEKGIWEIKDDTFYAYISEENGKPSKRIDNLKFDSLSGKKASRTLIISQDISPVKMNGKKVAKTYFDADTFKSINDGTR